jgi:hypothetical protein
MLLREIIGVNSDKSTEHIGLNTLCDKMWSFFKWWEENCDRLGYYATSGGNFVPTFRYNLSVHEADRLSRNVGEKLPLLAA